jgi:hypothetical protein
MATGKDQLLCASVTKLMARFHVYNAQPLDKVFQSK